MNAQGRAGVARASRPWIWLGWQFFFAVLFAGLSACSSASKPAKTIAPSPLSSTSLAPSPHLIVGRVLAVDVALGSAIIDLASDAPPAALVEAVELLTRTLDLRSTGRLRTSRYLRGRTLGTTILSGEPSPGDEVVWLAP
ncbi:MAG: hypothetical protein ABIZ49_08405 [Opitutaceae bacterium]